MRDLARVYDSGDHEILATTVLDVHTNCDPELHPLAFYRSARIKTVFITGAARGQGRTHSDWWGRTAF